MTYWRLSRQLIFIAIIVLCGLSSQAQTVTPITNEISFYKNMDDFGRSRGTTLQIISINSFNIGTDFIFEFTSDFNWNYDFFESHDQYIELSLVKPIYKSFSANYQRVYGTFIDEPVNQFGIRLSFFTN